MVPPIRLLIVAADPLVRAGLRRLFDNADRFEIVDSSSPSGFIASFSDEGEHLPADIVIWDLGWESGDLAGLDFRDFEVQVAALVSNEEQARMAWRAGATAILNRDLEKRNLKQALEAAVSELVVIDSKFAAAILSSVPKVPGDLEAAPTPRELQVLQLLSEGLTNRAIAGELGISEHTVKFHINAILKKFDAQSRTEAVIVATKLGFIVL